MIVLLCRGRGRRSGATHRRRLEIDGALRVEDEVEQTAVGVVALELDIERRREVERRSGGGESALDVVGLLSHGQRVDLLQLQAILVLDLLLVVGDQSFLLNIAVVEDTRRRRAVLIGGHVHDRSLGVVRGWAERDGVGWVGLG